MPRTRKQHVIIMVTFLIVCMR